LLDRTGERRGFVASLVDISRSLEADQFARRTLHRAYYEQAPVGHVVFDLEYRIVEANRAFAKLVGRSQAELIGQGALELVHPDDASRIIDHVGDLVGRGRVEAADEIRMVRPDGPSVWLSGSASLVYAAARGPRSGPAIVYDLTDPPAAEDR